MNYTSQLGLYFVIIKIPFFVAEKFILGCEDLVATLMFFVTTVFQLRGQECDHLSGRRPRNRTHCGRENLQSKKKLFEVNQVVSYGTSIILAETEIPQPNLQNGAKFTEDLLIL